MAEQREAREPPNFGGIIVIWAAFLEELKGRMGGVIVSAACILMKSSFVKLRCFLIPRIQSKV
uniref:CCR protein n=1 Tax=Rhizophora mucronata TaxID=61149 RepID=A0A2P2KUX0_RHIMU